jgi:hypothetical protein
MLIIFAVGPNYLIYYRKLEMNKLLEYEGKMYR